MSSIATVALLLGYAYASSHITKYSEKESFYKMSVDRNKQQPQIANIIMYVGFAIFGIMYLYTVFMIFRDTANRDKDESVNLENDEVAIRDLKINKEDPDFKKGLQDKLDAVKHEDKGDDQLYGTAANLTAQEW